MGLVSAMFVVGWTVAAPLTIGPDPPPWRLPEALDDLYARSCPSGTTFLKPEDIGLSAEPVSLHKDGEAPDAGASELSFVGGYVLESDDPRFGGVSGLAVTEDGDLIGVSDAGHFVWIDLDETDGVAPVSAAISSMLMSDGRRSYLKEDLDAEGLDLTDGLAIVSFEQDHRIVAFDLETCGGGALPVRITSFGDGRAPGLSGRIRRNNGMEGLALLDNGTLAVGLETREDDQAVVSFSPGTGVLAFDQRFSSMGGRALTGMDYIALEDGYGVLYAVHRSFSILSGPNIAISATPVENAKPDFSATETLLTLKRPDTVDNFEAIAAKRLEDGGVRLYLMSDDNYQSIQRTLLLVFDDSVLR